MCEKKAEVYIALDADGDRLVVDGPLSLLRRLLDELRPERAEPEPPGQQPAEQREREALAC